MDVAIRKRMAGDWRDRSSHLSEARLCSDLELLIHRSLEDNPDSVYLREHAQPNRIAGHVRAFGEYVPHLPDRGHILDWGCHHAPDSCLLKSAFENRFRLHGCDFVEPQVYARFHEYAGLDYRRLTDIVATPYETGSFDAVIGSGVLEHVAMEYESLKELHRILKPGGVLIVTLLPNRLSWREWGRRVIWKRDFHERCYGLAEARRLLKRTGFVPLSAKHACDDAIPFPLRCLCSTLTLVAHRVHAM